MLDAMRMRTACFARALQRYTSRLSKHFLLTFQEVTLPRKTRNQLNTYVFDAADVNPRLQLTSPLMRCGKTRVLETLSLLVSKPLPASNVSPSAIFRVIEQSAPTLLIDEADTFAKDHEELRGLLNSGHTKRTAYVLRAVPVENNQWEAKQFSTWAPMALAGIGRLFPTLEDRSIRIVLKRKLPTEKVSRLPLRNEAEPFATLRRQCTRWGQDHVEALRSADPSSPPALNDRAADNWRPLIAIAEAEGGVARAHQSSNCGPHRHRRR